MSFFVTSQGPDDGANLGGLDGADAHCQQLAEAAGVGGKTWRAYLSTSTKDARERIGTFGIQLAFDLPVRGVGSPFTSSTELHERPKAPGARIAPADCRFACHEAAVRPG